MYRLVNVPEKNSKVEIRGEVEGETIYIVAAQPGAKWRDGRAAMMASTEIGDHLLAQPEVLRRRVADDLAFAIREARDAGYAQAMADVRQLIGAKAR